MRMFNQSGVSSAVVILMLGGGCGPAGTEPAPAAGRTAAAQEALTRAPLTALGPELSAISSAYAGRAAPAALAKYEAGVADIAASPAMASHLREGDRAPDFTLPAAGGEKVSLAVLRGRGPVVVQFYRGVWCPFCNVQLRRMEQDLSMFAAAGASVVAVSPQTPERSQETAAKSGLTFPVLSDAGNETGRAFGIVFRVPERLGGDRPWLESFNGDDRRELPLAATFVIDRGGVVRYAFVTHDYRLRAEPEAVLRAVELCR
ncbi:MAG: peroxiredoxin-like family protein [Phycisphaerales bacterium]